MENLGKMPKKVLDNAGSHDILALNKSIHQSNEKTFGGMNHETFHCIHPFGSPDVERPCACLCGGRAGRQGIRNH